MLAVMRRSLAVMLALSALASCRAATPPAPADGDAPPTALAESPVRLPAPTGGSDTPDGEDAPVPGDGSEEGNTGSGGTAAPTFRRVGSIEDERDDAGAGVPGYADLLAIGIEDDGHSARITVRVASSPPDPMPDGEQMGVGVDLYRRDTAESDYQVYAQGTEDGWLAYLATPEGIVEYPGRFAMGGARLVFTVPWSSLDGIRGTRFSGYTDWDRERPVLNEVGADRAPARGTARFAR